MSFVPGGAVGPNVQLPFDLSKGQPILALAAGELEAVATMRVQQLLTLVPDPRLAEDPTRTAEDRVLAQYAELRKEVQRAVEGAKAKNAYDFKNYILSGLRKARPYFILPSITLYHPKELETVSLGQGMIALLMPYGDFLVAIDGETQRIAWQLAANEYPDALGAVVKVVLHHGKTIMEARQGFHDLNTKEVKPNPAVAISMDTVDIATRIARRIMETSDVIRDRVNLQRRSLRARDSEVLTISALRTGIVTTILGPAGLQVGMRSIGFGDEAGKLPPPPKTDLDALEAAVVDVWTGILEQIEDQLDPKQRLNSVVSYPAVLAGVGIVAHHAMPSPPRRETAPEATDQRRESVEEWTVEEVLERLDGVIWERVVPTDEGEEPKSVWAGIAGKFTPKGRFSIGGPKEFGRQVADALENPESELGRRVRVQK